MEMVKNLNKGNLNCTFVHNIWKAVLFSVYFKMIFHILQSSVQR